MAKFHQITPEIFTITEFLSPEECAGYIDVAESLGFSEAPINTLQGPQIRSDVRNNERVMLDDEERACQLWQRASQFVPHTIEEWQVVGVNERLRFYRYDEGQQFDWHYDGSFERTSRERSRLSFMVYLNEDFEGGETAFPDLSIRPQTGLALCFVHLLLHKGEPVTRGRKYVLRTDVMYRRNPPRS